MSHYLIFILTGAALLAQPPRYIVHDLGPLQDGAVTGINIHGQVIGYEKRSDTQVRSFRTVPNSPINWTTDDIGSLGGPSTIAQGINAQGQVVGGSTLSTGETRAFRTAPNTSIQPATDNLGTLDPLGSSARAINDLGQVTGSSGDKAFLTAPNSPINPATDSFAAQLDVPYITPSEGAYINNRAHVLGVLSATYPVAFFYDQRADPVLTGFGRAPAQSFAGITDADQVVFGGVGGLRIWQNGKITKLIDCTDACPPSAINNSLQVVGRTSTYPFLYTRGVAYDLTTLIAPGAWVPYYPPQQIFTPLVLNDLGQIAGLGMVGNETHAIRLDPVASVSSAIDKAMSLLSSIHPVPNRRSRVHQMMKLSLASKLNSALASANQGNTAATRGFLNEFESLARAQVGQSLTSDQANQLINLAEAAIALT